MKNNSFSVIKAVEYGFTTFFRYGTAFLPAGLIYAGFEFGAPILFKLLFLEHGYALDSMKQILPQDWNLHLVVSHAASILSELETLIEYLPLCLGAGIVYYIVSTLLQEGVIQMGFDVYDHAHTRASRVFSWLVSIKRALKKTGVSMLVTLISYTVLIGLGLLTTLILPLWKDLLTFLGVDLTIPASADMAFIAPYIAAFLVGSYINTHLIFAYYSIVCRETSIIEAVKESICLARGNILRIWLVFALGGLITAPLTLLLPMAVRTGYIKLVILFNVTFSAIVTTIMILALTHAYRVMSPAEPLKKNNVH